MTATATDPKWWLFLILLVLWLMYRTVRGEHRDAQADERRRWREQEYARRHQQEDLRPYDWNESGV